MLPHRFPLTLVESPGPGRAVFSITRGSWWVRDGVVPPMLVVEALAQGSAVALGATGDGAEAVFLAAIDRAEFSDELKTRPLAPGDRLEVRAALRLRLGPLSRIEASLKRDGQTVLEASFTTSVPGSGRRSAQPRRDASRGTEPGE